MRSARNTKNKNRLELILSRSSVPYLLPAAKNGEEPKAGYFVHDELTRSLIAQASDKSRPHPDGPCKRKFKFRRSYVIRSGLAIQDIKCLRFVAVLLIVRSFMITASSTCSLRFTQAPANRLACQAMLIGWGNKVNCDKHIASLCSHKRIEHEHQQNSPSGSSWVPYCR